MKGIALASPGNSVGGTLLLPATRGASPTRSLVACIHGGGCHSAYFNAGETSLTRSLLEAEHAVLLVDRPGTQGRPLLDEEKPLAASISAIRDFIGDTWHRYTAGASVALVGHSIGGALALTIAAGRPDWPLTAVAVSGIGDEPPPQVVTWSTRQGEALSTEAADFFLGPEGTYDWRGLTRLRKVAAPWNIAERVEVVHHWPSLWRNTAPLISVPVQIRLADGEKIWMTGPLIVQRMAAALTAAPEVDASILPGGGHLYEFHKRGPELIAAQLTFINRIVPRMPTRGSSPCLDDLVS